MRATHVSSVVVGCVVLANLRVWRCGVRVGIEKAPLHRRETCFTARDPRGSLFISSLRGIAHVPQTCLKARAHPRRTARPFGRGYLALPLRFTNASGVPRRGETLGCNLVDEIVCCTLSHIRRNLACL